MFSNNLLMAAAGGGDAGVAINFEASPVVTSPTTTDWSGLFDGIAIGDAASDRVVVVSVVGLRSAAGSHYVASMTIGGITATRAKAQTTANGDACEIWAADVPTGTTADIDIIYNATVQDTGLGVWSMTGSAGANAVDTASDTGTTLSQALTIRENGAGFGVSILIGGTSGTWTNLDEDVDEVIATEQQVCGSTTADGTPTISMTSSPSPHAADAMVLAAWGPKAGALTVQGVQLNGSDNCYTLGSAYTSVADTKMIMQSFWFKQDASGVNSNSWGSTTPGYYFSTPATNSNDVFHLRWANSSNVAKAILTSTDTVADTASWHHYLAIINTTAGVADGWYIIDGSEVDAYATKTITSDGVFDLTNFTAWKHFNDGVTGAYYDGAVAENYINTDFAFNGDIASVVERFRTSSGKPADLGSDGSYPTGSQPVVYQTLRAGDSASDFATNQGYGGNMTESGTTVALASSSPSD